MKIAVVNLVSSSGGGYTVLADFYRYVAENKCGGIEWLFILGDQPLPEVSTENIKSVRFSCGAKKYGKRFIAEYFKVPRAVKEYKADALLSLQSTVCPRCECPQYVYLQQHIPLQDVYSFSFVRKDELECAVHQYIQGYFIKRSCRTAETVFVQTEHIKKAAKKYAGDKLLNIGYSRQLSKMPGRAYKPGTDFFYPCGPVFYKNFFTLNEAVNILAAEGFKFRVFLTVTYNEYRNLSRSTEINSKYFIFLGKLPYERVLSMYAGHITLFPSFIESLGLPLTEARAANSYIITADLPYAHESLDDYPNRVFFPVFNSVSLALEMKKAIKGEVVYRADVPAFLPEDGSLWQQRIIDRIIEQGSKAYAER